ncbi:hypothetical protein F4779DRAFT_222022 [Xylariaceae sp. FL0662B]|nr:hypothetical protein F4779DRAFT_222022 [Xylariaceae sp. FL0662B]
MRLTLFQIAGKQLSKVLPDLKGVHGSSATTRPSFMSICVQLSRAESWARIYLLREPARGDFIELKNVLDESLRDAVHRLGRLGGKIREPFEDDNRHELWLRERAATPESISTAKTIDKDASLWTDSDDSDTESQLPTSPRDWYSTGSVDRQWT